MLHEFCTLIKEEGEEELLLLTMCTLLTAQWTRMYRQVETFTVDTDHFTCWLNCKQWYSGNRLSVDELHDVQDQDMLCVRVVSFFLFFLFFFRSPSCLGKSKMTSALYFTGVVSITAGVVPFSTACTRVVLVFLSLLTGVNSCCLIGKGLNCLHAVVMIDVA